MVAGLEVLPAHDETAHVARSQNGWLVVVLAMVASATMVWLGTGLTAVPWLTWLAPIPLLALALRVRTRTAALAGFGAWTAGSLNMWSYYVAGLEVPVGVVAAFLLLQALTFAAAVAVFRALVHREQPVLAVLAAPAIWAGAEYLTSLFSPGGTFTSLSYTQTEVLPVIQLASATGISGVSYLLLAVPAIVVTAAFAPTSRRRLLPVSLALIIATAGYSLWQLRTPTAAPTTTIALVNVWQPQDSLPIGSPQAREILDTYLSHVPTLANAGASVMLLPEKVFRVTEPEFGELGQRLITVATANRITIVIGLTLKDSSGAHNIAMAYNADGAVRYDKHHLVTGWEDHFTPGRELAFLPGSHIGLAICKDLDHPGLIRSYAQKDMTLLLVPALDFDRDGWLHSRIAVVRGVENGVTVIRAAGRGRLTASDQSGRLLTDVTTGAGSTVTTATVQSGPASTIYSRLGDWFAWICLILAAWTAFRLRPRR